MVNWVVLATIQAEEFGITQGNVGNYSGDDTTIQKFLGQEITDSDGNPTTFDPGLGLATDFVVDVISAVGNYGEIYDRNVGPDTPLGLPRGYNSLWLDGGLLYAPPYR